MLKVQIFARSGDREAKQKKKETGSQQDRYYFENLFGGPLREGANASREIYWRRLLFNNPLCITTYSHATHVLHDVFMMEIFLQ